MYQLRLLSLIALLSFNHPYLVATALEPPVTPTSPEPTQPSRLLESPVTPTSPEPTQPPVLLESPVTPTSPEPTKPSGLLEPPATPITPPPGSSPTISEPKKPPELLETRLVLKLKQRRVFVYKGDKQIASYPVAVGKKGWETPTGNFKIIQMVRDPVWQNPWTGKVVPASPKNPIGERWIGFWTDGKNQIGFHGTPTVNSIGQAASHGCVRMFNKDVKAMFELVKVGTPVIVQP